MRVTPDSPVGNPTISTSDSSGTKKRIHNVFIIDASGSMAGGKYNNAISGLNELLNSIREDKLTDNTISIVEFEGTLISERVFMSSVLNLDYQPMGTGGYTPLNQAVGETIENILQKRDSSFSEDDKVLINVFTDGGENNSQGKYKNPKALSDLIKKVEAKGFTVTFQGTKTEVAYAVDTLNLDFSNTNVHDNTMRGIADSFHKTVSARVMYSKAVFNDEDVKAQFYSKTVEPKKEDE
jgi:uncharacterized protein YegL